MIRTLALSSLVSLSAILLLAAGASPATADAANLLGVFKNWQAYSTGSGSAMTCFAMSQPRATEPKKAKRGAIYLMISDWPGRKVKAEPEIVPGYQYKVGSPVTLGIGAQRFIFFSRNDDRAGSAWLQNLNDGNSLTDALSHGVSAVAIGLSVRGTKTVDTYSLAGFPEALAKIHAACNM